jgi:hypothetical protein
MSLRHAAPYRGILAALVMCALSAPAAAQRRKTPEPPPAPTAPADSKGKDKDNAAKDKDKTVGSKEKVKNFDFNALDLNGRMRTPQLLYFLERANEELERASLEKRSFIPHMVRSVEEEQL